MGRIRATGPLNSKDNGSFLLYNFVIWQQDPDVERRILSDLDHCFEIQATFKVEWSRQHWPRNLSRLYLHPVNRSSERWAKLAEVGYKPFTLVVIRDPQAHNTIYNDKGIIRYGNRKVFDAKHRYRGWSDSRFAIHGSADDRETDWNLNLILGSRYQDILSLRRSKGPTEVVPFVQDAWGAAEWSNHADMFDLLGRTTPYAVMRHRDPLPPPRAEPEGQDIDILVEDINLAANALNPVRFREKEESLISYVRLDGGWNKIELYDARKIEVGRDWAQQILSCAVDNPQGFRMCSPSDDFYLYCFNGLKKNKVARPDYRREIEKIYAAASNDQIAPKMDDAYASWAARHLVLFLRNNGLPVPDWLAAKIAGKENLSPRAPLEKSAVDTVVDAAFLSEIFKTPPLHTTRTPDFQSAVWRAELKNAGNIGIKLVDVRNSDLRNVLTREHVFLEALKGQGVPQVIWGGMIGSKYCLIMEWIDAEPISGMSDEKLISIISRNGLDWLHRSLSAFCDTMEAKNISHRDLVKKNVFLTDSEIWVIDFGWAVFTNEENPVVKAKFQDRNDRKDVELLVEYVRTRVETHTRSDV